MFAKRLCRRSRLLNAEVCRAKTKGARPPARAFYASSIVRRVPACRVRLLPTFSYRNRIGERGRGVKGGGVVDREFESNSQCFTEFNVRGWRQCCRNAASMRYISIEAHSGLCRAMPKNGSFYTILWKMRRGKKGRNGGNRRRQRRRRNNTKSPPRLDRNTHTQNACNIAVRDSFR